MSSVYWFAHVDVSCDWWVFDMVCYVMRSMATRWRWVPGALSLCWWLVSKISCYTATGLNIAILKFSIFRWFSFYMIWFLSIRYIGWDRLELSQVCCCIPYIFREFVVWSVKVFPHPYYRPVCRALLKVGPASDPEHHLGPGRIVAFRRCSCVLKSSLVY